MFVDGLMENAINKIHYANKIIYIYTFDGMETIFGWKALFEANPLSALD